RDEAASDSDRVESDSTDSTTEDDAASSNDPDPSDEQPGADESGATDGDADIVCRAPGEYCSEDEAERCCADSTCVVDSQAALVVCAAHCSDHLECQSGCCAALRNSEQAVCSPAQYCEPPPPAPPPPSDCGELVLVAYDGSFLGVATSNEFTTDGVCNPF